MLAIVSCFSSPESGKVKTVIEAMLIEGIITTPFIRAYYMPGTVRGLLHVSSSPQFRLMGDVAQRAT